MRMEQLLFESSTIPGPPGTRELSPSVFRAIESSLDLGHIDRPLLQNLTELTFKQVFGEVSLRDLCVFLGPRLKTLHLSIPFIDNGLGTFAEALKAKCPAIENLYISSYGREEWASGVVSDIIHSQSALRKISWDSTCDLQTLKYLSSLPSLRSLNVHLPQEFVQGNFLDATSNIPPFLAMRHLHVSVASITDAGQFLQATFSSIGLESLSIALDGIDIPNPDQLHAVLAVMQRSSFCDTLTTFALQDRTHFNEGTTPLHSLDARIIAPLLQCRNLEHVTINISYGHAEIDNSLLEGMASAWPCLRHLSLQPYYHARLWHSKANFQGLIYLAQHCHSLQSVSLQFNLSLPTTAMDLDQRIHCESLTQLYVFHSHVSDPRALTNFLANVFPNLRLHHNYAIRTTPRRRTMWLDSEDPLREYEQSLEFVEMVKRWKDVDQMLTARRLELSQSPMNTDVRMQSSTIKITLNKFPVQSINHCSRTATQRPNENDGEILYMLLCYGCLTYDLC
jgi:hypothetical protein